MKELNIYSLTIQKIRKKQIEAKGENLMDLPEFQVNETVSHFKMDLMKDHFDEIKEVSFVERTHARNLTDDVNYFEEVLTEKKRINFKKRMKNSEKL